MVKIKIYILEFKLPRCPLLAGHGHGGETQFCKTSSRDHTNIYEKNKTQDIFLDKNARASVCKSRGKKKLDGNTRKRNEENHSKYQCTNDKYKYFADKIKIRAGMIEGATRAKVNTIEHVDVARL
jgi:hypothetical protein